MASKTAVFFIVLAFWGILDIQAASVTGYKKETWVDRLAGLVSSFIFPILSLYYHGWCTRISLTLKYGFHVLLTNDSYKQIRNPYSKNYFIFQPSRPTTTKESFIFSYYYKNTQHNLEGNTCTSRTNVNNMPNAVKPPFTNVQV